MLQGKKLQNLQGMPNSRAHIPRDDTEGSPRVFNSRMADLGDQ
jgi:hypothetical protein